VSRKTELARRVTIKDIALAAGVSKSTVSLVLKNSPLISKATAENVRSASLALGYVYNRSAANLRTQRSNIVGVIISDLSNPFFSELVTAMENDLESRGVVVMLANTAENPERQRRTISTLLEHNVDGLFISPAKYSTRKHLGPLLTSTVPAVFVNRYLTDFPGNYVGADNVIGVAMATERLLAAGHRRIAFIGGGEGSSARPERLEGFRRAHESAGTETDADLIVTTSGTRHGGYNAIRFLLSRPNPPTAAFCYNDFIALGVLLGLQSRGIRPGKDFGVFGFDDISEARYWSPSLSTVSIPPELIGKRAARMLLEKEGRPGENERVLIAPKLAIRESCGTKGNI
jgi:LacI family transcriptional regulator, galactose operon repressor